MAGIDPDRAATMTERLASRLAASAAGTPVDRRTVLGGLGVAGGAALVGTGSLDAAAAGDHDGKHGNFGPTGEYDDPAFEPHEYLYQFNTGHDGQDSVAQEVYEEEVDGERRTVRHFELAAVDRLGENAIQVAPGVTFEAWTFDGQVPGPTLRAVEGDLIRVTFTNGSAHGHTIHPHLRNLNPEMDGVPQNGPGVIDHGDGSFTYEWLAQPAGMHFYHCHALPLKEHIHRGLYGVVLIDPDPERVRENPRDYVNYHGPITDDLREDLVTRARSRNHEYDEHGYTDHDGVNEMVMVMNGFDTNFDGDNEVYAANTQAFAYGVADTDGKGSWEGGETIHPIRIDRDELQRVYLLNAIEFDPINSFHTHSQFFDYYDHGTTLYPTLTNVDTIMQCQAQRGILEIDYSDHDPGLYMFHAHQSEFAELGWMSFFEVES